MSNTFAFLKLAGTTKFHKPFTSNRQGKFNLEELNTLRERVRTSSPFSQRKQKVTHLSNRLYRVSARGSTFRIPSFGSRI